VLLERHGSIYEVLRQLDFHRPIKPTVARSRIELPPICYALQLETKYVYDYFGEPIEMFTDEAMEAFWEEVLRRARMDITPELEAYADALAAEADIILALVHYEIYGYIPITPLLYEGVTIRRVATMLDMNDGLNATLSANVLRLGGEASAVSSVASRPAVIPSQIDNTAWRDAYRHFYWTRQMARSSMGPNVARVASNNHEWAGRLIMLPGSGNFTNAEIITVRRSMAIASNQSLVSFNANFNNDFIMDFWNNREGINRRNTTNAMDAFVASINSGNIILSIWAGFPHSVTAQHRSSIWSANWYIHFSLV